MKTSYHAPLFDFSQSDIGSLAPRLNRELNSSTLLISTLQQQLDTLPHLAGDIAFDVEIEQQTIECVVLYRGIVFVIASDSQSSDHQPKHIENLHHLALHVKQHHKPSLGCFIVPVMLTYNAQPQGCDIIVSEALVADPICDNGNHFAALIEHLSNQYKADQIIASEWLQSGTD